MKNSFRLNVQLVTFYFEINKSKQKFGCSLIKFGWNYEEEEFNSSPYFVMQYVNGEMSCIARLWSQNNLLRQTIKKKVKMSKKVKKRVSSDV